MPENQITTNFTYLISSNFVTISHINCWVQLNSCKNVWKFWNGLLCRNKSEINFLLYLLQYVCRPKYSAKTTHFSILNPFLHFLHPFVMKYFGIFVFVPNVIYITLPSKVFHEGNLEETFINFVAFCLHGLVCWRLIVSK